MMMLGGKMASTRGNNDELNEYELQRQSIIANNKRKLDSLNLPTMGTMIQAGQTKKRTRELIPQVMHQLEAMLCVQGHKETLLKMQMSRLVKVLVVNQLEISYAIMKVM
ncbi:hypothetical protein E2562_007044 [Oryza meyeriana var. granulata]|uniref:Uncharacterized protein n=1 Tax=Oryza meyeriana var. granulata TaxID=110450 RepID=A0A6G1EAR0_9ORYZ|nr:hypothetical protein E2562_007044 [Oryza meyeriana var. granulata]